MLIATQLRAIIQRQSAYQRVRALRHDDWDAVNTHNPLMRVQIQIDDLLFLQALQREKLMPMTLNFEDYAAVIKFCQHHENDLSTSAKKWLLRYFK